jgi:hypothetical protein
VFPPPCGALQGASNPAAAWTGSAARLIVDFPPDLPILSWPVFVAHNLPSGLPGFGRIDGFAINWTPDSTTCFDRTGTPIETLDHNLHRGTVRIKPIPFLKKGLQ